MIDRPNQELARDITYVRMARGFAGLTAVVDWFTRRVLAWHDTVVAGRLWQLVNCEAVYLRAYDSVTGTCASIG